MLNDILPQFHISSAAVIEPFGTGLINRTWRVQTGKEEYILQRINEKVFKNPEAIAGNIENIQSYLAKQHPEYFFVAPVRSKNGQTMVGDAEKGFYRLFPFVQGSRSFDVVQNPDQAFEAARQFGLFTRVLSKFPAESLQITLPGFHDLSARYAQFRQAVSAGNQARRSQAQAEINFLEERSHLVGTFEEIRKSGVFRTRVTHHDTKISNVLFDAANKAICVIDLDTVMPGYFISDVGDMLRTYLSPVSEEEQDLSRIEVREDYFSAILEGYLSEMYGELNEEEIRHFVYAGMFMIYMQALRFLSDYLTNDLYYGAAYEGHNYVRAQNQVTLLKRLEEKKDLLYERVLKSASLAG